MCIYFPFYYPFIRGGIQANSISGYCEWGCNIQGPRYSVWSGGVLSSLNVLRNHHAYFFTDCTELHSDTVCRISLLLHSYQHAVFLIIAILIGLRQNLSVVLTYIFFDQGCWIFFMYLLAICGPSGNLLFPFFTHLLIGLFFSVFFLISLYIQAINLWLSV